MFKWVSWGEEGGRGKWGRTASKGEDGHQGVALAFGEFELFEDGEGEDCGEDVGSDVDACVGEPGFWSALSSTSLIAYLHIPDSESIQTMPSNRLIPEELNWRACKDRREERVEAVDNHDSQ